MDLDSLINSVKEKIGNMIQKPKMADKLLQKPPFRFLHDTITAMTSTTGFGEGLFSGDELDSGAIAEKTAKIAYLEKIFSFVGICKGSALDIRAQKVVAGLEPENTNVFLLALADCATDGTLDNTEAVRRCLAGEAPGMNVIPRKRTAVAESKESAPSRSSAKAETNEAEAKYFEAKPAEIESTGLERGKSRGGTRGGKPNLATADTGLGGFGGSAPNLDSFIEKCDGTEATTQAMLGDMIQRPKLSEKLLSKPPFRFLHDIIMEIYKVTGFGTGLFTEDEMDSAKVSDKTQKMIFLEKVVKVVSVQ